MEQLKNKTLTELQAIAYQNLVQINGLQKGLEMVEAEIASRQVATPEEKKPLPKK